METKQCKRNCGRTINFSYVHADSVVLVVHLRWVQLAGLGVWLDQGDWDRGYWLLHGSRASTIFPQLMMLTGHISPLIISSDLAVDQQQRWLTEP